MLKKDMEKTKRKASAKWVRPALIGGGVLAAAGAAFFVHSESDTPPDIPRIILSSKPLYAAKTDDKPAMALALSVEYPTVGAQYVEKAYTDDTYSNKKEYIGYYDFNTCYSYVDDPAETPAAGLSRSDYKRFRRVGPATDRMCADAFSGNFLNWASSSAIDMLRLALSGGDRYVDEVGLTVLQRAVLPVTFWNSRHFPAKKLTKAGGTKPFWGAVPQKMIETAQKEKTDAIWVGNDLDKIYFGKEKSSSKGSYKLAKDLSNDGYLFARVQVCDQDSAGLLLDERDYNFCFRYPNGDYKPTGVIQKYSNQLRLAAFGYAMENTKSEDGGRFGGVLRAPMKYVGNQTFSSSGADNTPVGGNPKREWDPQTGIFAKNPEGDEKFGRSGVINYLNQFGRTGEVGKYKTYDPVGELYHETLAYLQGKQPTPDAIKDLSDAMYDGFPVYTDWASLDPYPSEQYPASGDYSCLKSNVVVIGDVNSWDGGYKRLPGYGASTKTTGFWDKKNNIPDYLYWTNLVRSFEMGEKVGYVDGNGEDRETSNPNPPLTAKQQRYDLWDYGGPKPIGRNGFGRQVDTTKQMSSYQIAGMAYWAHMHDIRGKHWSERADKQRPGLRVKTYVFDVNESGYENIVETRRANKFFMAAKYGGYNHLVDSASNKPYNTYGNPFVDSAKDVFDNNVWQKLDDPGEAASYYLQSNARGVLSAFESIFSDASTRAHSIAGLGAQSQVLTDKGLMLYQASFDTSDWTGDLSAFKVEKGADGKTLGISSGWSAQEQLQAMPNPALNRKIILGGAGGNQAATDFQWGKIGSRMQGYLNAEDGKGEERLAWLRGEQKHDDKLFRDRKGKLLGDIINSGAVYSGAPSQRMGTADYADFAKKHAKRDGVVFVGANDGMLHAFDAGTGKEVFAYIPGWLAPNLPILTQKDYDKNHQSFVDASPVVADAQVSGSGGEAAWKTVLVGGTGAGGRGVYALDVTEPGKFAASSALWEFTANDDPDMGYVVGSPKVVKIRTNAHGEDKPVYKWFVVVGSGVNNYIKDKFSDGFSKTGEPAIFLLDLSKPGSEKWQLGRNYYKISLPFNAKWAKVAKVDDDDDDDSTEDDDDDDSTGGENFGLATGVVNFNVALNEGGAVSKLFAGDLHGQMWMLNFNRAKNGTSDWSLEKLSNFHDAKDRSKPGPMFIARDANGAPQPIMVQPMLARGPDYNSVIVGFGTGKYFEDADTVNKRPNTFYAIYDAGDEGPLAPIKGREHLKRGLIDLDQQASFVGQFKWGRATTTSDNENVRAGWYLDFAHAGERQIAPVSDVFLSSFILGTVVPDADSALAKSCGDSRNFGVRYVLDLEGNGQFARTNVGLYGGSVMLDVNVEETPSDSTGRKQRTITRYPIDFGSDGRVVGAPIRQTFTVGRLSWRQIQNYLDQKNAPQEIEP
ncbi:MAG: PilC/PilY family type IV pilus protein [Brachymonas sp.]|nr:PilC/PilY family type IV pilus protein [Brachymonas sp.]